jgi:hypothetical protein
MYAPQTLDEQETLNGLVEPDPGSSLTRGSDRKRELARRPIFVTSRRAMVACISVSTYAMRYS